MNLYRPPKDNNSIENIETFVNELSPILEALSNYKANVIVTGDFNIDLLELNNKPIYCDFFDTILSYGFQPAINLFYQVLTSNKTLKSGIILSDISDHLPYFVCFDKVNCQIKLPVKTIHKKWSNELLNNLDNVVNTADIYSKLNYNLFEKELICCINNVMPNKYVKFNHYKHKKSEWVTYGIIKSIKYKDKLYKLLKLLPLNSHAYNCAKQNLVTYKCILNKCIREAKTHYSTMLNKYKSDSTKTWKITNSILHRNINQSSFPQHFDIDNSKISDHQLIANAFNKYFTEIGTKLASDLKTDKGDDTMYV